MVLVISHEDDLDMGLVESLGLDKLVEQCHFCSKPTRFWNHPTNCPVCPSCSLVRSAKELPQGFKATEKAPKQMSNRVIELRQMNDELQMQEDVLLRQLHNIRCQKITVHRNMKEEGLVIKNPVGGR